MISLDNLVHWLTPLSSAHSITMTALNDESVLSITFSGIFDTGTALVCFTFRTPQSYKVLSIATQSIRTTDGPTVVERSRGALRDNSLFNWNALQRFLETIDYTGLEQPSKADRYVFVGNDHVVEVISGAEPEIYVIGKRSQQRRA